MKKILIASNVLLICVIIFQACNTYRRVQVDPSTDKCAGIACKSYDSIGIPGLVDGKLVRSMSEAYSHDIGKAYIKGCNSASGRLKQDAWSVCFNIEQIKNLIWKMEYEACRAGCNRKDIKLGIRFYFIKYPELPDATIPEDFREIINLHKGKHSLVMIPAVWRKGRDTTYYDFVLNGGNTNCFFQPVRQLDGNPKLMWAVLPVDEGDNHGGIAPPPRPGTYPTNPE